MSDKALPSFLREEVKEPLTEFMQKHETVLSEREMAIFGFGFEYGQVDILKKVTAKKIREMRAKRLGGTPP
jgi:menaquinone-dependent protoporphyrinogen IX oxidase